MRKFLMNFVIIITHHFYMKTIKIKMKKLQKNINKSLVSLRNSIDSKEIPANENSKKIVNIFEKNS